jgi:hypothetical protein
MKKLSINDFYKDTGRTNDPFGATSYFTVLPRLYSSEWRTVTVTVNNSDWVARSLTILTVVYLRQILLLLSTVKLFYDCEYRANHPPISWEERIQKELRERGQHRSDFQEGRSTQVHEWSLLTKCKRCGWARKLMHSLWNHFWNEVRVW